MLGFAVALTSCSDDNEYVPAGASAGAYFSNTVATQYTVTPDETSVAVEVLRTKDAGNTFEVTAVDPSGLFTVPTTVTFDGNSLTSAINIAFDADKLETDKPYPLTLTLGGATAYGKTSIDITIKKGDPVVIEKIGNGTYTYYCIWSGDDTDLPVTRTYDPSNPNYITYTVGNWGGGTNFNIVAPDASKVEADGTYEVVVPCQYTGYTDSQYGPVYVADMYNYFADYNDEPATGEKYAGECYYDVNRGTYALRLIYYIPQYETGSYYLGEVEYEYLQMDGYPVYDVEVTYNGLFISKNGSMAAKTTITSGADVAVTKAVMVEGNDPQAGITAILANADGVQEFTDHTINADFEVTGSGSYCVVAVTFDAAGEAQAANYDKFTIQLGDDNANWNELGNADFIDGWCARGFQYQDGTSVDPANYMYSVPVQVNKEDPTLFRLVQPYGPTYPLAELNAYPATRNVEFYVEDDFVLMLPQPCGFGASGWKGEMSIGNQAGYILSVNEGASIAAVRNFMVQKGYELDMLEDGTITFNKPWFGAEGIGDGTFGYTWGTNSVPAYIFMPEATADAKARVAAKAVAAPAPQGIVSAIKAQKAAKERYNVARAAENIPVFNFRNK